MNEDLKENILFSHHNLVTDSSFGEMNLILCRNVLIYFDQTLQNRVLELFASSLCQLGHLCLGTKETIRRSAVEDWFSQVCGQSKIYKFVGEEGSKRRDSAHTRRKLL